METGFGKSIRMNKNSTVSRTALRSMPARCRMTFLWYFSILFGEVCFTNIILAPGAGTWWL